MKYMKKVLAVMVAVLAICLVATPAFAASIEVDSEGEESYVAYKIFDVTKTDANANYIATDKNLTGASTDSPPDGFAYTISENSAWFTVLNTTEGKNYFTLTKAEGGVYVVELVGASTAERAKEIADWLGAHIPSSLKPVDKKYEFASNQPKTQVDDGYYLITSSLGTKVILATTDIKINEKNEYVTDDKVVEKQSVTVGESATYYVKVYLPESIDTSQIVTVHDVLAKSETASFLTFKNDVEFWIGPNDPSDSTDPKARANAYKALDYSTLTESFEVKMTGLADDCDFEINIDPDGLAGNYIVFKYSAELHSNAEGAVFDSDGVPSPQYPNTEHATYYSHETVSNIANVVTYKFEFTKVDGEAKLDGAEFELRPTADGDPIAFIKDGTLYKKADSDDIADPDVQTVTTIVVNSRKDNKATVLSGFGGADDTDGTNYYLVETKAPAGYNKLTAPIIVNVKDNGTISVKIGNDDPVATATFNVENNTGTVLPSTGGIGTTIFYIIGGALVVGAIVTLVTRRNMSK